MGSYYLGIDVGAVAAAAVLLDEEGRVAAGAYEKHAGEPEKVLRRMLAPYPRSEIAAYALTGAGARRLGLAGRVLDATVAQIEAVRRIVPEARNILYIGGGSFSLTTLDGQGRLLKNTTNSACASGTGAFLDQQALRLGIAPEDLGRIAATYAGLAPSVATRCAVFAKTDMIHLQQEGFPVEAVAKGLCHGLGASTVDGLLGGTTLAGTTALVGGVALNECVAAAVRERLGVEVVVPENPERAGALGAAFWAREHAAPIAFDPAPLDAPKLRAADAHTRPPLALTLSRYPDAACEDYFVDDRGTEVALLVPAAQGQRFRVAMGIDIGSTSTKAALVEASGRTVAWCYRKTAGVPLRATQHVLQALRELEERHGIELDIAAVGTTGSGRKMVGRVIGADLVLNEITAHARAAAAIDPAVDTIIELGGQDAKFTQMAGGVVYNSVMNYVCAAGTGSFIEEQAQKLKVPIEAFADLAMGVSAPVTSDRCTVYMERDLDLLLAEGWSKAQVAAAVLHSVRDNYLNKVVGGLGIGDHVLFQGATARNRALVAAFEQRLGRPINVSPLCHVTGALGMALFAHERVRGPTAFRGLAFADVKIVVENEQCTLCRNRCKLSVIRMPDDVVAWGLKCGREYDDVRPKPKDLQGYAAIAHRDRLLQDGGGAPHPPSRAPWPWARRPRTARIGIPRALTMHSFLPFWRRCFAALGCETVLSAPTTGDTVARGESLVTAEFCAPVLAALGHADELFARDVDYVFVPHQIREACPEGFTNAYFCCYVQAYPSLVRSALQERARDRLLAPVVDFSDTSNLAGGLHEALRGPLGVTRRQVLAAVEAGRAAQDRFRRENLEAGRAAIAKLAASGGFGIVLIGRPYNALDRGLNLDLPRRIAEMGPPVLAIDQVEASLGRAAPLFPNMYWSYGQRILSAAHYTAAHPSLFPVYFTSFSCGPDSYVLSYFKEIMARAGKPYLVLQFDGHGADAGYLTRIEAALESFQAWRGGGAPSVRAPRRAAHVLACEVSDGLHR